MSQTSNLPEYTCPLCQQTLLLADKTLRCNSGHTFDYAKEGYVHLLPVQLKKSLNPGDDKNMVVARREFLQQGYYDFLREFLLQQVQQFDHMNLLDLGCGEGFYTNYIESKISVPNVHNSKIYGVDISKDAVKYASKRNKNVHYSVATNAHTPFNEKQFELIINIFAPLVGKECKRILKTNGRVFSVAPAPNHLIELKQEIYDTPELHQAATIPEGFKLSSAKNIQQKIEIDNEKDINNLLTMTPFGWKITESKKQKLLTQLPFKLTLDFTLNEFIVDL